MSDVKPLSTRIHATQIAVDIPQIPDCLCSDLIEPILPLITAFYAHLEAVGKFEVWRKSKQQNRK